MPTSVLATTFHYAATRRITDIGLLVSLVGGLAARWAVADAVGVGIGGLLIAVGLAAVLVALHFGVSPYRHGPVTAGPRSVRRARPPALFPFSG